MNYEKNKELKYKHCYIEDKVVLLGVDKRLKEESIRLYEDTSAQIYDGLAQHILRLDIQDRELLFNVIDEYISVSKNKKEFNGAYWDVFLDFILMIKRETLYDLSVKLSRIIEGNYEPKRIYDKLDKAKKSKGNPQDKTLELIELICYYMGGTKSIISEGQGTWYTFENNGKYTLGKIKQYCDKKKNQNEEIILKDMIRDVAGINVGEICEMPIRIWFKERLIDEKLKEFILILIKNMKKSRM